MGGLRRHRNARSLKMTLLNLWAANMHWPVNSATAALHLGLEALGIAPGDKVVVPTMTFTSSAEVVRYLNADPIFVDCDSDTFCITADLVYTAIECQQEFGKQFDIGKPGKKNKSDNPGSFWRARLRDEQHLRPGNGI